MDENRLPFLAAVPQRRQRPVGPELVELNAERVVVPGGRHFVAGAHGFSGKVQRFLIAAK
jgi:hypothetical protein